MKDLHPSRGMVNESYQICAAQIGLPQTGSLGHLQCGLVGEYFAFDFSSQRQKTEKNLLCWLFWLARAEVIYPSSWHLGAYSLNAILMPTVSIAILSRDFILQPHEVKTIKPGPAL